MEDDDQGSAGRSGRVRKKSAKVLEMEEFEQAEKVSHNVKKAKLSKGSTPNSSSSVDDSIESAGKKLKPSKGSIFMTLTGKQAKSVFSDRPVPAELTLRVPPSASPPSQILNTKIGSQATKQEFIATSPVSAPIHQQPIQTKTEDAKSVIKYLLSSPTAGSTPSLASTMAVPLTSDPQSVSSLTPKTVKKQKSEEKSSKSKPKEKRPKIEIMSPAELLPPSVKSPVSTPSLKMKITGGSNPLSAQVALDLQDTSSGPAKETKSKKSSKKVKVKTEVDMDGKPEILGLAVGDKSPPVKKPKVSKKKEKLIQDAISAATHMPNLAALVATASVSSPQGFTDLSPPAQKTQKKKTKTSPAVTSDSLVVGDFEVNTFDVEPEESTLVIAEKEKKKKKVLGKKKAPKEKDGQKEEKAKKIPKRAPTAYMLFCNTHRASIVAENPGIEFAGISRKLGELWQAQSNKQKLQWRRKAQRRMKKSNLISTGKTGKESQGSGSNTAVTVSPHGRLCSTQKLSSLLQRPKGAILDEAPLSPTKNFSIEPMDVAAHLKLLGESLSIIGMRLQEHKGMIAVQGSLSVLLDSLICACGPLLCLTQQVPGMDGCTPSLHAQTLDSVAYVMPGL